MRNFTKLSFFALLIVCEAKIVAFIHEGLEDCTEPGEDPHMFDVSTLKLIATSDSEIYLNGTWKFLKETKSVWLIDIYTEKYGKGSWYRTGVSKKVPDFCNSVQSRLESWYFATKEFTHKNCPFPAGVRLVHIFIQIFINF